MLTESLSLKEQIVKYKDKSFTSCVDEIAIEFPLTIFINQVEFATMVCSPENLDELVLGFLASEGVIRFRKEIKDMTLDRDQGFAYVELYKDDFINQQSFSKRFIGSCCGKSRQFYFQNDVRTAKTSMVTTTVTAEQCLNLMKRMQADSFVFQNTGGVHNAALCSTDELLVSRSDIGRHNALDKLYGYSLLNGIPVKDKILVFSGRISSEILTKAAKIGVGIVLSKSAPTDLAIRLAEDLNITAVGFIRGASFNIYSKPERIIL